MYWSMQTTVLSSAAHYSRPKIIKNSDKHWTISLHIHIKLGDNLTSNDRDILIDISTST